MIRAVSVPALPQPIAHHRGSSATVRLRTLLCIAVMGLLVGSLGRIPVFSTGARDAPVLVNDLFIGALLDAFMISAVRARSLRLDAVAGHALAFAAIGAVSTLLSIPRFGLNGWEVTVSLAYLARWLFYFGLYVVAINALRSDDAVSIWRVLEATVLAFAAFGVVQSAFLPNFAQIVYPESRPFFDWDPQGHRLVSTWLDPNLAGAFIAIALLVELGRIAMGCRVATWKSILLGAALLLTASRSGVLAAVAGVGIIVVVRGLSKRFLRLALGFVVLLVAASPALIRFAQAYNKLQIDASALQRVVLWLRGLRVFADHPVIGIGFNAWAFVQERYGYDRLYASSYSLDGGLLFVAVMTGLIGLAVYVAMIAVVVRRARAIWRDTNEPAEHRGLALGVVAGTIGLTVHSLFANSLFFPYLMETIWILWGVVLSISAAKRVRDAQARRQTAAATVRLVSLVPAR
jgi:O-antigen ligase